MSNFRTVLLIGGLVLIFSVVLAMLNLSNPTFYEKNLNSEQNEITLTGPNRTLVLTREGKLSMLGWSKNYDLFQFNPGRINPSTSFLSFFNRFRYKKWEAFVFIHPEFILGTAVFDLSHVNGYLLHYANLKSEDKDIYRHEFLNPLSKSQIPDDCLTNCDAARIDREEFHYHQRKEAVLSNQFLNMTYNRDNLKIEFDIKLNAPNYESLVSLTPISADSTLFYYNTKMCTIPVTGTIKINGTAYKASDMIVTMDSGRGVWPVRSGWIWASANGISGNNTIGLNFGHGFSHPEASRHTEDSFFINGKVFKLNAVESKREPGENGMDQWTFSSNTSDKIKNKCEVTFTPIKKLDNLINLIIGKVRFFIRYGKYSGYCQNSEDVKYEFDIYGIMEDKLSIW